MSYLFLYVDMKHKPLLGTGRYYGGEQPHTHYGIFDKATMWRAFKHDYKVIGHGEHPMQRFLKSHNLEKLLVGHMIEITHKKQAVWLKLNYDRISKVDRCEYAGCYVDLNPDELESTGLELQKVKKELSRIQDHINLARSIMNQFGTAHTNMISRDAYDFTKPQLARMDKIHEGLSKTFDEWYERYQSYNTKREEIEQRIQTYLNDHKVS